MTANVFDDDRLACEEAGMNDFIAKLIKPNNLFETILKWLPKNEIKSQPLTNEQPIINNISQATDTTVMDKYLHSTLNNIEGIELDKGLKNVRGDMSMVVRYIKEHIPSIESLHLPVILKVLISEPRGLIPVVGYRVR